MVERNTTRIFPLRRLKLGVWESLLHLDQQIFLMVPAAPSRKLIFISVHPKRDLTELTLGWQKSKKNILKFFG